MKIRVTGESSDKYLVQTQYGGSEVWKTIAIKNKAVEAKNFARHLVNLLMPESDQHLSKTAEVIVEHVLD